MINTSSRRSSPSKLLIALLLAVFAFCLSPRPARAGDIDSAKQQLEKVKVDIDSNSWDSVDADIKATEEFLNGLPAAESAPVQKELDDLKQKAAAGVRDHQIKAIVESSTRDLNSAADDMNSDPAGANERATKALERLNSDAAKKYVPADQLAKLQARAVSLQQMASTKVAAGKLERANAILKELDDSMAAQPFKGLTEENEIDQAAQRLSSLMSRVRGALDGVPATDPAAKAITDKLAAYDKQIQAAAGSFLAVQAGQQLDHMWKAQQEYFAGWDQEKATPTWPDYLSKQSEEMSHLLMPKTCEVLIRLPRWFSGDTVKNAAEQYKNDPTVKAVLTDAHKTLDTAAAKLNANFNAILDTAEKADMPKDSNQRDCADLLAQDANNWFQGTQFHDANVAHAKKLYDKWNGAIAGASAAQQETLNKLTKKAAADWPAIATAIKYQSGFTPAKLANFTGSTVRITGPNRLGWDYAPGGYNFAVDINGMPVAGKFDPTVAAAVADANKQTGQDLPDDNWELFAVVEGPGKIQLRTTSEGKVTVDGQQVGTVTAEGHQAVDCAVVRIIALHAGPVAVAPGSGAFSGPTTWLSFFFHLFIHLVQLIFCLTAAALLFLKNRPTLATQTAGAAAATAPLTNPATTGPLGLLFFALGILWLLSKLIIGDLFPAASLAIVGFLIAADWLQTKKILSPSLVASLKPLTLPAAIAAALFGLLHLCLANWYFF